MVKVKIKPTITHDVGYFIVPYIVPSWCSSCPPERKILEIKSENKPTKEYIEDKLKQLGYEIED